MNRIIRGLFAMALFLSVKGRGVENNYDCRILSSGISINQFEYNGSLKTIELGENKVTLSISSTELYLAIFTQDQNGNWHQSNRSIVSYANYPISIQNDIFRYRLLCRKSGL